MIKKKIKAILLDRDGVINVDKGYIFKKNDFKLISGVIEALKLLESKGYKLFIITNQSGIARGYFKEKDLLLLHSYMLNLFDIEGIKISKIKYCPHYDLGIVKKYSFICDCRKPSSKMIDELINEFNIDIKSSFMIGDKITDMQAGKAAGLKSILISDSNEFLSNEFVDYVYLNLFNASKFIS